MEEESIAAKCEHHSWREKKAALIIPRREMSIMPVTIC